MRIKTILATTFTAFVFSFPVFAQDGMADMMANEHGGGMFHMIRFETDYGASDNGPVVNWDLDGWIGGDDNKVWLKSEGEQTDGILESSEFWALYSHNIATFWDVQAGVRYDVQPNSTVYGVIGINGLAPYYFETEAHLFISDQGDISARGRTENDFLITQKLIIQPYVEANLFAQDVASQDIGTGLSDAQIGLQTRYEFTRKFAPYVDVHYGQKFGETASIAKDNGDDTNELVGAIGLRLMF